jgi:hypothetical protein
MSGRIRHSEPSIEIRIPLEGEPRIRYFAATFEDSERLRLWLRQRRDLLRIIYGAAYFTGGVIEGPPSAPDWIFEWDEAA